MVFAPGSGPLGRPSLSSAAFRRIRSGARDRQRTNRLFPIARADRSLRFDELCFRRKHPTPSTRATHVQAFSFQRRGASGGWAREPQPANSLARPQRGGCPDRGGLCEVPLRLPPDLTRRAASRANWRSTNRSRRQSGGSFSRPFQAALPHGLTWNRPATPVSPRATRGQSLHEIHTGVSKTQPAPICLGPRWGGECCQSGFGPLERTEE